MFFTLWECFRMKHLTISLVLISVATTIAQGEDVPSVLSYGAHFANKSQEIKAGLDVSRWTSKEKTNPWEISGLFEGDIMKPDTPRNGLENVNGRWPKGQVPYYIEKRYFNQNEINKILLAMNEFHRRTCIRFRPYAQSDPTYIWITGAKNGCWSFVGRVSNVRSKGQQVNLQPPACLTHGTIVHELLHTLGFYHQHSAANRDRHVRIAWHNIMPGMEVNFKKIPTRSYGAGYDYDSIMHYSAYALSKNGQPTIVPLVKSAKIGQRMGLSVKDVTKVLNMYNCKKIKE